MRELSFVMLFLLGGLLTTATMNNGDLAWNEVWPKMALGIALLATGAIGMYITARNKKVRAP